MSLSSDVSIRTAWPEDQAFVADVLSDQLRRANHKDATALTNRILDSASTRILIATRDRRIIGWLAYAAIPRIRAVLFAYVRKDDRGQGVGRSLLNAAFPSRKGQVVYAGLTGGMSKTATNLLLHHYAALQMNLEDLI